MSKKYQRLALIGSGSFGKAWLVTRVGHTEKMVSKEIKVSQLTEKETDQCVTEVMVLASCNHGNIIQYIDAYVEERCLYIVMEFADGGNISLSREADMVIYREGYLDRMASTLLKRYSVQFMSGSLLTSEMSQVTRKPVFRVLRQDLKSQNVFLTGNDIIKLGDFGIAKVLHSQDDHAITTIGTPFYISPEICQKKPYNSSSDMWAAGCLLFEMCLLRMPFTAPNFTSLVLTILQGDYDPLPRWLYTTIMHPKDADRTANSIDPDQSAASGVVLFIFTEPSSRLTASEVLRIPEISVIVRKLQSKLSDCYRMDRSTSPFSKNRQNGSQHSRSPRFDKLPKGTHAGNIEVAENKENRLDNKIAPLRDRSRQDLIKSTHQGRSLTPDLRRVRRGERQHSEPRRHSYSNNEKENIPYEKVSISGLKKGNDNHETERKISSVEEMNTERKISSVEEMNTERKISSVEEMNKRQMPCVSKERTVDTKQHADRSEVMRATQVSTGENNSRNNSSKISKKTYVIKESVLRRLSQASPVLSETIRQQRASLSLDTEIDQSSEVKTPTASLFSCKDGHGNIALSSTSESPVVSNSLDTVEQSEDDVFEIQDMVSEVRGPASYGVQQMGKYETGPFHVELQKRRVDSTTYVVKSGSVNNNYNTDNILDVNEILYLAASVSKQNSKLASDILLDSVVSHLGESAGRALVSMVTKHLEAGQSYQSLVKSLCEKEKVILPIVIRMYSLSL